VCFVGGDPEFDEGIRDVVDAPTGHSLDHVADPLGDCGDLEANFTRRPASADRAEERLEARTRIRLRIRLLDEAVGLLDLPPSHHRGDELRAVGEVPVEGALGGAEIACHGLDPDPGEALKAARSFAREY